MWESQPLYQVPSCCKYPGGPGGQAPVDLVRLEGWAISQVGLGRWFEGLWGDVMGSKVNKSAWLQDDVVVCGRVRVRGCGHSKVLQVEKESSSRLRGKWF